MPDRTEPAAGPASAESPADALHRLEARLGRAAGAAERLIAEATASVAGGRSVAGEDRVAGDGPAGGDAAATDENAGAEPQPLGDVPPAGWAPPGEPDRSRFSDELELLMRLAARLAELVPPDLRRRLADAMRELLLAVRALIDWYVARIERRTAEPPTVVDIPIL